ncbi:flagellar hook-associated protein FlgK [Sulfuricurvum sp. IAE1]|jgi:flagellar hook-associated protein 1 FlgK|uniref:flagellar hook-associated protein FlgK n=1 Tax=Sulfuricurvum sp. IAE1 TaxID=2546102 RepID=UPI0010540A95|nr:flagellar hook-associated protein FlgK [Sulfuricurvum sp. IAE1]MDD3770654.1 flagellar hook-associated protein FlgK [Sulfuricurvum sp.]MDX9966724.1 flagellar hook-associated protein FlgK [Sulfuricurvum sp.]TDA64422.1 flagellar hook-associated protein FlgK [Sulfuricurvum sp. IAE1]
MASIFNALHIGYTGLNAAQIGIDTTGHNISNAETEGYSRQRVVTSTAFPVSVDPGQRGNGTQITEIVRIYDSFVFNRYSNTAQSKSYSDTMKKHLEELSTYFPDIDNIGIKSDLQNYFNGWQALANNPGNSALKVSLAQLAQTLTQHVNQTRDQIAALQSSINDQVKINIEEVNRIAEKIAGLNKSINEAEAGGINNANDLRDQRTQLEMTLSKLIGAKTVVEGAKTNNSIDSNIAVEEGGYTILVGGFNIVDGSNFHPIGIESASSSKGYNTLYFERQDGVQMPFAQDVRGGKVGALLELRGSIIGADGEFENGFLQKTIDNLDTFAAGLIEATNNLYAQSATTSMQSTSQAYADSQTLLTTGKNFSAGTFDIVVYDINGNVAARRTVTIDDATVMGSMPAPPANSIVGQLNAVQDDTGDGNALNDIDDMLEAQFGTAQNILRIDFKAGSGLAEQGYTFAIEDNGTNFAGVTGLSRFFDGDSAKNIDLNIDIKNDVTKIRGFKSPVEGDSQTALAMVELQFSRVNFMQDAQTTDDTLYGYYDALVTTVGTTTNSVILSNDTITAQFSAIQQEYDSISKVSIDEEMANLIRYQTSYGAAAKVITTIDQMMQTLLGLKQ